MIEEETDEQIPTPNTEANDAAKETSEIKPIESKEEVVEHFEFEVEIIREKHGFVKVKARNKDHAKKAIEVMSKKRMLQHYQERFEFVRIGEVKPLNKHD